MPTLPALITTGLTVLSAAVAAVHLAPQTLRPPRGHLILQVEGDANGLRVTRITAKPDVCGPQRLESDYQIVVQAADGSEIARHPLDLRLFDLDPARVGAPLRVEGCRVVETRVATLASIPDWPDAIRLELVHGTRRLGRVDADAYSALLAGRVK